jgi:hypothetical protein
LTIALSVLLLLTIAVSVLLLLTIALSVLVRFTATNDPLGIFKLFLKELIAYNVLRITRTFMHNVKFCYILSLIEIYVFLVPMSRVTC